MFYPYTDRQQHFIAVAGKLADVFAERAADFDRTGTFPYANFADIRAAGLPALVVPTHLGGWGADLLETVMTMERLAQGDGSTALSLTMHMQTIGGAVESGNWPPALLHQVCRAAVEDGALINSCATEPELGSPSRGGRPKTTAHPLPAGEVKPTAWVIDGRKSFASMAPVLDFFIIPAALQDGSDEVARFVIPRSPGIEILETWDAMGMRTTGSHDLILTGVEVPAGQMIMRTAQLTGGGASAWFMLAVSAVYLGVGQAALAAAARYAQERVPTALGRPIASLDSVQRHLGEGELLLSQARLLLYHVAGLWDAQPATRARLAPLAVTAKVTATNHAVAAVDQAMRAAGGAAMTRHLPLERYYRDVRAGLNHPIGDDEALLTLGRQVLAELAFGAAPASSPAAPQRRAPAGVGSSAGDGHANDR